MTSDAIADFGSSVREKLADGDAAKEDQLRAPLEVLMRRIGRMFGLRVVPHGEVRLVHLKARPDYSIDVAGARVGYIELKAPGKGVPLTPSWKPTTDDTRQWENLKALPNLIYSDGNQWALYRYGKLHGEPALLHGDIVRAGRNLKTADGIFAHVMDSFLFWEPESPRSLPHLVSIVAGLCRLLNEEVAAILRLERQGASDMKLFEPLVSDWRRLLYPDLSDTEFANAYAQTVTFALLLARVDGISFQGLSTARVIRKVVLPGHVLSGRQAVFCGVGRLALGSETAVPLSVTAGDCQDRGERSGDGGVSVRGVTAVRRLCPGCVTLRAMRVLVRGWRRDPG